MKGLVKPFLFSLIVRPIVGIVLGLNVRHRQRLPVEGPAIIVANHNSHLDTLALMSLFKGRQITKVRPIAAADYWMKGGLKSWIAKNAIDVIPIERRAVKNWMEPIKTALEQKSILILFPEGSRGNPEELSEFKGGVARLSQAHPEIPIYPIFIHGLGKSLPRGEAILVPHFCDLFVGEPLKYCGDNVEMINLIRTKIEDLAKEGQFPAWD